MNPLSRVMGALACAALSGTLAMAQGPASAPAKPLYNTVKQKLLEHKQVFSFTVFKLDVANYCEYAKHYDYAWFDMQHSSLEFKDVEQMISACPKAGAIPFVRLPDAQEWHIQHATDAGALGIIVPTVDDVDRAREAAKWVRYPPVARRSLGRNAAQDVWGPDYRNTYNDNVVLVLMIETPTGVANAADIAAVPGVDVVIVGNNDLTSFSGYAADTPEYQRMITKIHDDTVKAGKIFGQANANFRKGNPLSSDSFFFQNGPSKDGWEPQTKTPALMTTK